MKKAKIIFDKDYTIGEVDSCTTNVLRFEREEEDTGC